MLSFHGTRARGTKITVSPALPWRPRSVTSICLAVGRVPRAAPWLLRVGAPALGSVLGVQIVGPHPHPLNQDLNFPRPPGNWEHFQGGFTHGSQSWPHTESLGMLRKP